eukprot:TRINITY_DN1517_c0_g2_i4.p1 TRINITY_DN1517_c0_g2~~TRINITY_DN1517_c0_g2_i4.p1  ORF type:complete len:848 (+),score=220.76 TRINITY_DN1517_c0_g2_i4:64-2607(+)
MNGMQSLVALTILLFFSSCYSQSVAPITTSSGIVVGSTVNGVAQWLSIPYAVSPAGNNRFKPPAPAPASTSIVNVRASGLLPICPQRPHDWMNGRYEQTEDCLVLNIWAPHNSTQLPVTVFIHGGSFNSGMGSLYNGSDLAVAENVVVVTINYRVSILGFLSLTQLVSESKVEGGKGEGVGMFGLLDQQLALKWVRDNIAKFGGAPDKVTIYGESAGAASVVAQLAIPSSKGLFRAAVVSSTYVAAFFNASFTQQQLWNPVVSALNCSFNDYKDVLSCLRNVPFAKINEVALQKDVTGVTPATADGVILPDLPYTLLKKKSWNNVPVLLGSNGHETSTLLQDSSRADCENFNSPLALATVINSVDAANAPAILTAYPLNSSEPYPYYENILRIVDDRNFRCPASRVLQSIQGPAVTSFMYSWEVHPSWITPSCLRDGHATELPYMFPTLLSSGWEHVRANASFTPQESQVSRLFQKILANFARTLDPSFTWENTSFKWPQFNALTLPFVKIALGDTLYSAQAKFRDGKCKYWDMGEFIDVSAISWKQVPQGEYINPKLNSNLTGWSRSPCPGLNTLANHGFLPRDGSFLTRDVVVTGIWNAFHVDLGFIFDALVIGPGLNGAKFGKIDPATNLTFFNLGDLAQHSPFVCEHDASLSRLDAKFGNQNEFNQEYFNQFLALADNGYITWDSIAKARVLRIAQCRKYNPDCLVTVPQQRPGVLEGALVLRAFSSGEEKTPLANVKSFFEEEKFPSNFTWAPTELPAPELIVTMSMRILNLIAIYIGNVTVEPIPGVPAEPPSGGETGDTYSKSVVVGLAVALSIVAVIAIIAIIVLISKSSLSSSPEKVY